MARPPTLPQGDPQTATPGTPRMSTRRKATIWIGTVAVGAAGTFAATTSGPSIHIGDRVEIHVQP